MEISRASIEDYIVRFEPHLLLTRRLIGWSAAAFGEMIGVSRQTINNLETGRSHLSKTEYLLIRRVLEDEFEPDANEPSMLEILLEMLVDHLEKYMCSCYHEGMEILHMSNPGDYPLDEDADVDYEIVEIDD